MGPKSCPHGPPPVQPPPNQQVRHVSRPCPSYTLGMAGVAGHQSHRLLSHSLSPKPQRSPCLLGPLGCAHTHTHRNHTPPHTRSASHAHTDAQRRAARNDEAGSCRPGNPLDSSVLMVPGGGEGGLVSSQGGHAEKSGAALEVGDHGGGVGHGDKSTAILPQLQGRTGGHIHFLVVQPPIHPRKVC